MKINLTKVSAFSGLAVFSVLAGCLGSRPDAPKCWLVSAEAAEVQPLNAVPAPMHAKIGSLTVRSPYDGVKFAVLRPDGSVAFDPANTFAAKPELMLKSAAFDVLSSRGDLDFAGSVDGERVVFEISVTCLALDCRKEGLRKASVGVTLVARTSQGFASPATTRVATGVAASDAADGNYSAAFSKAFSTALIRAYEGTKQP